MIKPYDIGIGETVSFGEFDFDKLFVFLGIKTTMSTLFTRLDMTVLIESIMEELCEHEKTDMIKYLGHGTSSLVWEIGNKIIKVGRMRHTVGIPYHHRLLQPIFIREFSLDRINFTIEVTHKARPFIGTSEEINKINAVCYELFSDGLWMFDKIPNNFGILLDDNKIHYDAIGFNTGSDDASLIDYNNDHKILPEGETCLIDIDAIEICDISKYLRYLHSIGLDMDTLETVFDRYTSFPYRFDTSYQGKTFEDMMEEILTKTKQL